ncbi:ASI3 Probable ERAD-associated E3 ubiquitin-protein ligase ASI1 [Candida maltosa Xu316]
MQNITNNSTGSVTLDDTEEYDYEYFPIVKLMSSLVDVVWEQSEQTSSINTTPWNRLGAISKYCCSIYGLACLIMALVLNRTLVMASTNNLQQQQQARRGRVHNLIHLTKSSSTIFQKLSMISFRIGVISLFLYQIYNILVVLNLNYHLGLTSSSNLNWLYRLIPDKYFSYSVDYFNDTKYMKTPSAQVMVGPTSDMYWPIFLTFCLSSFIETFIAAIKGEKPYTESGITIFEHSLAFQEFSSNGAFFFGSSKYYKRPTEQVLLTTLFSILNHLNIHIGAILNGNKYRLIPSSIFGMTFLTYFLSLCINSWDFLQFPFILILTFTPQVLIFLAIFLLAVVVNGFKLQGLNYASFFLHESANDVGDEDSNSFINTLNINLNDDFYTALLNIGILAITSAGKSSYITELSSVNLDSDTWVERSLWERLGLSNRSSGTVSSIKLVEYFRDNNIVGYGNLIKNPTQRLISGHQVGDFDKTTGDGKRSTFRKRFLYLKQMIIYTWQLLYSLVVDTFLLEYLPNLFKKVVLRRPVNIEPVLTDESKEEFEARKLKTPPFLRKYMKRRILPKKSINCIEIDTYTPEEISRTYATLLLSNNELSEKDTSGNYQQEESESEYDYESDMEDVTTLVRGPIGNSSSSNDLSVNELFSAEELNEIFSSTGSTYLDILQKHMSYNDGQGKLTRSKYRSLQTNNDSVRTDESEKLLEILISKRVDNNSNKESYNGSERSLDCVICQTNVREIITWPCKCFAICEGCRLSLVSKGIEGCVCCRREVEGVSKIFIP